MQITANYSQLEGDLFFLDDCPLECEPMTQLISFYLTTKGIAHRKMIGLVKDLDRKVDVFPHCWIQLPCGAVIDFRLRMWINDSPAVPHGIFTPSSQLVYTGDQYHSPPLDNEEALLLSDNKMAELIENLEVQNDEH